ncbi:MAG: hypothetical protein JXB88_13855 [Spirochaetales bacterium]|nr:hypothetical protein [Spirochaetales bacterium]
MCHEENRIKNGLLSFFKQKFPAKKNICIAGLTRMSDGWETDVYSFILECREGTEEKREELILRIYPGDNAI